MKKVIILGATSAIAPEVRRQLARIGCLAAITCVAGDRGRSSNFVWRAGTPAERDV